MPKSKMMSHARQLKNLEMVNLHAAEKELKELQERVDKLRATIAESEDKLTEYDKMMKAIQSTGEV